MPSQAQVPDEDRCEVGIAAGSEHRERMAERPQQQAGDPQLKAEPERSGDRSVEDCKRAGSAAEKDRLDQSAVDRRLEAREVLRPAGHEIRAPPPKLKKERKKEEAAKA